MPTKPRLTRKVTNQDVEKVKEQESYTAKRIKDLERENTKFKNERNRHIEKLNKELLSIQKELKAEIQRNRDTCIERQKEWDVERSELQKENTRLLLNGKLLEQQVDDKKFFTSLSIIGTSILSLAGIVTIIYEAYSSASSVKSFIQTMLITGGSICLMIPIGYFLWLLYKSKSNNQK
jgi:predicted RNase H-like nuclease (RuvC/YqgF family)